MAGEFRGGQLQSALHSSCRLLTSGKEGGGKWRGRKNRKYCEGWSPTSFRSHQAGRAWARSVGLVPTCLPISGSGPQCLVFPLPSRPGRSLRLGGVGGRQPGYSALYSSLVTNYVARSCPCTLGPGPLCKGEAEIPSNLSCQSPQPDTECDLKGGFANHRALSSMRDANIGSQILKPPNSESDFHPLPNPHKLARQFLSSWTQTFLAKGFFKTRLFLSLWCGSDIPPPHKHTCVHACIHTRLGRGFWKNVQEAKRSGADCGGRKT